MADEITVSSTLKYSKSGITASISGSYKASQTGSHYIENVQDIGTSPEETLDKGDIGTVGYAFFKNLDTTNFLQIGSASGAYTIKLKAGESTGVIPWNGTAVYAKADTATVKLGYMLIEL